MREIDSRRGASMASSRKTRGMRGAGRRRGLLAVPDLVELERRILMAAPYTGDTKSWMSLLPDNAYLNQLSIPGTHDSMTYGLVAQYLPTAQTQTMTLVDQLNAGVRFLDIRVGGDINAFSDMSCYHGDFDLLISFNLSVANVAVEFLKAHPTETIVMKIKNDHVSDPSQDPAVGPVTQLVNYHLNNSLFGDKDHWYAGSIVPSLGAVRGKIVVVDSWGGNIGIPGGWADNISGGLSTNKNFYVQDNYSFSSDTSLAAAVALKESHIAATLDKAQKTDSITDSTWFLNYTTASAIDFSQFNNGFSPDAFAFGDESRGVTPGINSWLNARLLAAKGRVGTVMMDFLNSSSKGANDLNNTTLIIGANYFPPSQTLWFDPFHTGRVVDGMVHATGSYGFWDTSSQYWFNGYGWVTWNNSGAYSAVFPAADAGGFSQINALINVKANAIFAEANAKYELYGDGTVRVTGGFQTGAGTNFQLSNYVDQRGGQGFQVNGDGYVGFFGPVYGDQDFGIEKNGSGTLALGGSDDNAYLNLKVNAGTVLLAKNSSPSVHAVDQLTLNGGTVQQAGSSDYQLFYETDQYINGGVFDFNGENLYIDENHRLRLKNGATLRNDKAGGFSLLNADVAVEPGAGVYADGAGELYTQRTIASTGGFTVVKNGPGTLSLGGGGDNAYLDLYVNDGRLKMDKVSSPSVHAASSLTLMGGTAQLAGTGAYQLFYQADQHVNGGVFDFNGNELYLDQNHWLYASGGTIANQNAGTSSLANLNTRLTGAVAVGGAGMLNLPGGVQGAGSLTKTGTGTVVLSGPLSYGGGTTVSEGTLRLVNEGLPGGNVKVETGGTLEYLDTTTVIQPGPITLTGGGRILKSGAGTLAFGNGNGQKVNWRLDQGALIDVEGGTVVGGQFGQDDWSANQSDLYIGLGAAFEGVEANVRVNSLNGRGTLSTGYGSAVYQTFTVGVAGGDGSFSGLIANTTGAVGSLTKAGAGNLALVGTNTFTGGTTIREGTVSLGSVGALGPGDITLNDSQTGSGKTALLVFVSASDAVGKAIGNNIVVNDYGTGTTIGTGPIDVSPSDSSATVFAGSLKLNKGITFTGGNSDRTTYKGLISGSVDLLVFDGGGRTTIPNRGNTLAGNGAGGSLHVDIVNGSTLQTGDGPGYADAGTVLPWNTDVNVAFGSVFQVFAKTQTIGGLGGGGVVQNIAASSTDLILGYGDRSGSFSGVIRDNGGVVHVTKKGTGTQTLSGVNTYSGGTLVTAFPLPDEYLPGGVLVVNGSVGDVRVVGATLAGVGTVGNVNVNGFIQPGDSNGAVGTLTASNLNFFGWGRVNIQIDGPDSHSALRVLGNLLLSEQTWAVVNLNKPQTAGTTAFGIVTYGSLDGRFVRVVSVGDTSGATARVIDDEANSRFNANLLPTPTLVISNAGGVYRAAALEATASVNGNSSADGVTPTFSYYAGTYTFDTLPYGEEIAAPTNMGNYTVVASFPGSEHHAPAEALKTFTIAPKKLFITGLTADDKVWDNWNGAVLKGDAALLEPDVIGSGSDDDGRPYAGDTVDLASIFAWSYTGTFVSIEPADDVLVQITGGSLNNVNYALATPDHANGAVRATIRKATPGAEIFDPGVHGVPSIYNGSPQDFPSIGLRYDPAHINTITFTYNGSATPPTAAGSYYVTATFAPHDPAHYDVVTASTWWEIQRAQLTVTAKGSATYGDAAATGGFEVSGWLGSDTVADLQGTPVYASSYVAGDGAGAKETISVDGLYADNYLIGYQTGSFTVDLATLYVTAYGSARYGDGSATLGFHANGLVNGDTPAVLGNPFYTTSYQTGDRAGTYEIVFIDGLYTTNYAIYYQPNFGFIVAPVPLTIQAADRSKMVGEALPEFTASYSGFVLGEDVSALETLPTLSTTATASSAVGSYEIDASGAVARYGNYEITYVPGRLSVYGAPTSKVGRALMLTPTYLISGTVTADQSGPAAPGIGTVAVYVAVDRGGFSTSPIAVLTPGNLAFSYQGGPGHRYFFRAVATDNAGHVESKGVSNEAGISIPVPPPMTTVASATGDTSSGVISLNVSGTDPYGPGLASFRVYVRVDHHDGHGYGKPELIGTVPAGVSDGTGTYRASLTCQAATDGISRDYAFTSIGVDSAGRVESAHARADATVVGFATLVPFQFTGLTIQRGAAERSFIRYVGLNFNRAGAPLTDLYTAVVANPSAYLRLLWQPMGQTAIQSASLSGLHVTLDAVDRAIELDFGANGLGGQARNGATLLNYWKALSAGDGWYDLALDASGSSSFNSAPHGSFFRLLGDVNGDGSVDTADVSAVAAAQGALAAGQAADLNGDGKVDSTDTYLVGKSRGRRVGVNPFR